MNSTPVASMVEARSRLTACSSQVHAPGVVRLALFGSVLRGETTADSDVDVLVEFEPGAKPFDRSMALAELLEDQLGRSWNW